MNEEQRHALEAFSHGETTAIELRRRLGGATYGEVLQLLSEQDLPLPRAPVAGREERLSRARSWMFRKMSRDLKLFVVDTGPLTTLAVAQSLDSLPKAFSCISWRLGSDACPPGKQQGQAVA